MKFTKVIKADENNFLIWWFTYTNDIQTERHPMYANSLEEAKKIADENTYGDEFCKVYDTLTNKLVYDTWQDMIEMREEENHEEDEEFMSNLDDLL